MYENVWNEKGPAPCAKKALNWWGLSAEDVESEIEHRKRKGNASTNPVDVAHEMVGEQYRRAEDILVIIAVCGFLCAILFVGELVNFNLFFPGLIIGWAVGTTVLFITDGRILVTYVVYPRVKKYRTGIFLNSAEIFKS